MCPVTLAALLGFAASACAIEQSGAVLAPADPHVMTYWKPDPLFGGVKTFRPVGPKAWGAEHKDKAPAVRVSPTRPMMDHHHMMNMDGM